MTNEYRTVTVTFKVATEGDTAADRATQATALIQSMLDNTKRYLGVRQVHVQDNTPCEAILWCGPGHQSKRLCEITGPHAEHEVDSAGDYAIWTGEEAFE